jgi:hypothetical protein
VNRKTCGADSSGLAVQLALGMAILVFRVFPPIRILARDTYQLPLAIVGLRDIAHPNDMPSRAVALKIVMLFQSSGAQARELHRCRKGTRRRPTCESFLTFASG